MRIIAATQTAIAFMCVLASIGFCGQVSIGPSRTLEMEISNKKVGQYEKLEMEIQVDGHYEDPFDPDVVDLVVLLKTPGDQQVMLPAFFCQEYERRKLDQGRNKANWYYPVGRGMWKARFAPSQTGTYFAMARLKDQTGTIQSDNIRFDCVRSLSKGFLRTSRDDSWQKDQRRCM